MVWSGKNVGFRKENSRKMAINTQDINFTHYTVTQKRLINFDLLRVAAMFGIVVLHYFTHGLYKHFEIYSGGGQCGCPCLRIISLCQKWYTRYAILL